MSRALLPLTLLAGLPLVLGCPPLEAEDTGHGPDADADADSDADSDSDSDADTDADVDTPIWEGQVRYRTTMDGNPQCDAVIGLLGSPYTGPCVSLKGDQCDFGFNIDATLLKDNSTAGCTTLNPFYTYLEDQVPWFKAPVLAYWTAYTYAGYVYYEHLLVTAYAWDGTSYGYGYYAGPFWTILLYDGLPFGTADYDYPDLLWDIDYSYYTYAYTYPYSYYCPGLSTSDATETRDGQWTATGEIGTASSLLDVWGFTVPDATVEPLYINVDTTDAKTSCHMYAYLNTPEGCSDWLAYENAECTYPPAGKYLCPAIDLDPADPGDYQLVISATGWYSPSASAPYEIRIESSYDPGLHAIADEVPAVEVTLGKAELLVAGQGTWIDD